MQSNLSKTARLQQELASYCKTGKEPPETSIKAHTKYYRELIMNSVKTAMKNAYPLSRILVGKKRWRKMVHLFFEKHPCQTPYYWQLPFEFYEFYKTNALPFKKKYPCLLELMYFEWLEIELFLMEDLPALPFKSKGRIMQDVFVPNPEIKVLALEYPVHLKQAKEIKHTDKGQYFVSIHRTYESKEIKYNDLGYTFVLILSKIHEQASTWKDLIAVCNQYELNPTEAKTKLRQFIAFALEQEILLGFEKRL